MCACGRSVMLPPATTDYAYADALAAVQTVYPKGVMGQTILGALGAEPGSRWVSQAQLTKALDHARALAALPLRDAPSDS